MRSLEDWKWSRARNSVGFSAETSEPERSGTVRAAQRHAGQYLADSRGMLEAMSRTGRGHDHALRARQTVDDELPVRRRGIEACDGLETESAHAGQMRCDKPAHRVDLRRRDVPGRLVRRHVVKELLG